MQTRPSRPNSQPKQDEDEMKLSIMLQEKQVFVAPDGLDIPQPLDPTEAHGLPHLLAAIPAETGS